ncbi:MAG TPA: hypothetical protein VIK64_08910, partial [Anaerolineales bacterium]
MSVKILRIILLVLAIFIALVGLEIVTENSPSSTQSASAKEALLSDPDPMGPEEQTPRGGDDPAFVEAVENTAGMVWDQAAQALAAAYDLHIVNVAW